MRMTAVHESGARPMQALYIWQDILYQLRIRIMCAVNDIASYHALDLSSIEIDLLREIS
jgi:hypothetical protein